MPIWQLHDYRFVKPCRESCRPKILILSRMIGSGKFTLLRSRAAAAFYLALTKTNRSTRVCARRFRALIFRRWKRSSSRGTTRKASHRKTT